MANIVKVNDDLKKKYVLSIILHPYVFAAIFVLLLIASALILSPNELVEAVPVLVFGLATIISVLVGKYGKASSRKDILHSGVQGEKAAANLFKSLPDSFTVLQNANIYYDGKTSEVDNVIVGPLGVFIVEVKNHHGSIKGSGEDHDWTQTKIGRGGTMYLKSFYNPTKQVSTHIYRLAGMLKSNGIRTYVSGAVYFVSPEANLNIYGLKPGIPVVSYNNSYELTNFIMSGQNYLSNDEINKIISLVRR